MMASVEAPGKSEEEGAKRAELAVPTTEELARAVAETLFPVVKACLALPGVWQASTLHGVWVLNVDGVRSVGAKAMLHANEVLGWFQEWLGLPRPTTYRTFGHLFSIMQDLGERGVTAPAVRII